MHDVEMTHAPHIQGLRVFQIINMAKQHCNIDLYLPDLKDDKLPSREFVVNVGKNRSTDRSLVNTLIPEKLQEMVESTMARREYKFIKQKNISMNVLPEIKRIFNDTKEVSSKLLTNIITGENGRFYHLVKNTDAGRAKRTINDEKEEEKKEIGSQFDRKNQVISDLQSQIKEFEDKIKDSDKNASILARLFEGGIIDEDGELLVDQREEE